MNNKKKLTKFYKDIKYFIFKIIYGKIDKTLIAKKNKKIIIKSVRFKNLISYKLYNIPNGRLYTDTVNDTAFILNKSLVKEPSFQYRFKKNLKIINGKTTENFVFENGTPNIKKKIKGNVFSLLTGGAGKNNYWHWIFDVLPRIGILEKTSFKKKTDYYLLPSMSKKYQVETLLEIKISASRLINSENNKHIICNNLTSVDHPINLSNDPSKSILNIPTWVIQWLKKKYIKKNYKSLNLPKKFFINRELDSNTFARKIINNDDVKNTLINLGFKSVCLSDLSFKNQVKLFNNAKFIIGLHGGGFANLIFSKQGTKVIEIASEKSGDVILNLAKKCKLDFRRIVQKNNSKQLKFQNSHILVDIDKLKKLILSLK
ncbi:MAG: glycosyltransferase family 61 protein [Pelagibacteraceae bacterium]|jgi:capsular polysaccharide biosynthesis protein|nr:glycosyltransferase family 61 protein [Pelagibacteraceae bacterium]